MNFYLIDKTGRLIGKGFDQVDPVASERLGKTVFMKRPDNCVEIDPPEYKDDEFVEWDGKKWIVKIDQCKHRPEPHIPTEREKIESQIWALKANLQETDYVVVKIAEGAATAEDYADIIAQRADWRAQINELESELEKLPDEQSETGTVAN